MNQKNKRKIALLTLCSALCLANASWGANILWNTNLVGNYAVGSNWVGNVVPGSLDSARINRDGAVVTLNTTNTVASLQVGVNMGGSATASMLIATNGALTAINGGQTVWIGQHNLAGVTQSGTLTVMGALTVSNGNVEMASFVTQAGSPKSTLIIDGGTAFIDKNINMTSSGGTSTTTSATFTLTNGGTISGLDSIITGPGTNIFNLSTISTGIDVVNMSAAFTLGAGNNILNVDLSSFDTNNGTSMTLFSYGSRSGSWSSVNIDSFDLGSIALGTASTNFFDSGVWSGNFVVSSGSLSLTDLQLVPEPSTYALLMVAAAGLGAHVVRRRRKR